MNKWQFVDALPVAFPRPKEGNGAALEDGCYGSRNEEADADGGDGVDTTSPALRGGFSGEESPVEEED